MRDEQAPHGAGDADVGEAALLLHLVGLGERPVVREDALLDADDEHRRELEALGRVQRHQHDLVVVRRELVGVGDQRDLLEELVEHGELASRPDQLAEVLDPPVGLDRVLGFELGEVAGLVDRRLQQVAGPDALGPDHRAEPVEQVDERGDAALGRPGDAGLLGPAQRLEERHALDRGRTRRAAPTLASPTPRLGTLRTRLTLTSSAGLTTARR